MTSAPFSLHCTICYDAFDLSEHIPVVLPCGHTYLCEPCSKRLKTCMECRTPLYTKLPMSPPTSSAFRSNSPRYGTIGRASSSSPRSTTRESPTAGPGSPRLDSVPLPIPKNLVLMALLEAAQNTAKSSNENLDKAYESGDDDEQVQSGIRWLTSNFGTYVVREREGLVVLPLPNYSRETKISTESPQKIDEEPDNAHVQDGRQAPEGALGLNKGVLPSLTDCEDVESVSLQDPLGVNVFPSMLSIQEGPTDERSVSGEEPFFDSTLSYAATEDQFRLRFGQTVQVVSFVDGVAVLARGKGYIKATFRQLVKIGEPVDIACKLEGMLISVTKKRRHLRSRLDELDAVQSNLSRKLNDALREPDVDPFAMAPGVDELVTFSSSSPDTTPVGIRRRASDPVDHQSLVPPSLHPGATESASFDNFVLSVTAAREIEERRHSRPPNRHVFPNECGLDPYYGCSSQLFPDSMLSDNTSTVSPIYYDVRRPRSSETRFSSGGVDWRTGLSGHRALSSASTHVDRSTIQRREIRMMGEHKGVAHIGPVRHAATPGEPASPNSPRPTTTSRLSTPSW